MKKNHSVDINVVVIRQDCVDKLKLQCSIDCECGDGTVSRFVCKVVLWVQRLETGVSAVLDWDVLVFRAGV
jgi:hypothetical protein